MSPDHSAERFALYHDIDRFNASRALACPVSPTARELRKRSVFRLCKSGRTTLATTNQRLLYDPKFSCAIILESLSRIQVNVITGGWWGETLRWRQNPGLSNRDWRVFDIDHCGNIETIRFYDIDGCGIPEVFPNTPNGPTCCYKLVTDASGRGTGAFQKILLNAEPSGHGLGFGDISGNGRTDVILNHGWLEHPGQNAWSKPWVLHPEFSLGQASVPILAYDVNHDGRTDLIVGQAHDYGLSWIEQGNDADGQRHWIWHSIDPSGSQFHDLQLVDLDNDGQLELVTGKRYRAHNDGDPGADDPIGIYYYKMFGGTFEKHVIDYGSAGEASGTGIYFWVQDVTGNGYPDLVAPGKDGLYLFENLGMRA